MKGLFLIFVSSIFFTQPQLGSRNPIDIPIPTKNFSVAITDTENNTINLTNFSCEGQVYLKGMLGKAQVVVSFEKIESINIATEGSEVNANIKLKDGSDIKVRVKKLLPFYGKTAYGNLIIKAEDIKNIVFK